MIGIITNTKKRFLSLLFFALYVCFGLDVDSRNVNLPMLF